MKSGEITPKQLKFACNIISGMENSESYLDAYPSSKKWNKNSLAVAAARLRKKPVVSAYIKEAQDEARERAIISRQRAMEILSEQAEGTVGELLRDDGSIDIDKVRKAGSTIKSIQRTVTTTSTEKGDTKSVSEKITLNGQREAVDSMAKMENWNKEKAAGETETVILNFNLTPSKGK